MRKKDPSENEQHLKMAAKAVEALGMASPGRGIPVPPDVAEFMGAFEENAVSLDDFDDSQELTPEEYQVISDYLDRVGATVKEVDPALLQLPFEEALEALKKTLGESKDVEHSKPSSREVKECDAVTKLKQKRFVQLSLLPEFVPAANAAIRSRLFTTGTGERYKFNEFTPIASWHKDLEVSYSGEELRQEELSVWIQLCKLAADDHDFRISTTRYKLLKALNKDDSGENRKILKQQLLRLFNGKLHISFGGNEYYGSILPEFAIENKGKGKIIANLNKTISKLLGIYDFTMLNMDLRLSLSPGGQWFHAFVKSQEGPEVIIPWVKIHLLSGSKETNLESYKKNFRKSVLKPLKETGFIIETKSKGPNLIVRFDKQKG